MLGQGLWESLFIFFFILSIFLSFFPLLFQLLTESAWKKNVKIPTRVCSSFASIHGEGKHSLSTFNELTRVCTIVTEYY